MSNTINDLRECLFATMRGLTDKENPMEIERAKAVSELAQTIINSAKVELEHLKITGAKGTGFLPPPPDDGSPETRTTANGTQTVTHLPGGTITQHRLRG